MKLIINNQPYSMDKAVDRRKAAQALDSLSEGADVTISIGDWFVDTSKTKRNDKGKQFKAKRGKPRKQRL